MSKSPGFYVLKPNSNCNFNCSFCSAKNLNIPLHDKVPDSLKQYIIEHNIKHLSITGGEPLINPRSYFEDLISIMEKVNGKNYEIGITSNLVLWYNNPEKYDYLFKHSNIIVETSFQYGGERKDDKEFTEERFIKVFNKFYERYSYPLNFIYVVNENNDKYALKACELAKKLNTKLSLFQQMPAGISNYLYPKHKILELYLKIIKYGYEKYIYNIQGIIDKNCPFVDDIDKCKTCSRILYVDSNNIIHEDHCEFLVARNEDIPMDKKFVIDQKCFSCKMLRFCNGCPIQTFYTKKNDVLKSEHCKWMKEHYNELKENGLLCIS